MGLPSTNDDQEVLKNSDTSLNESSSISTIGGVSTGIMLLLLIAIIVSLLLLFRFGLNRKQRHTTTTTTTTEPVVHHGAISQDSKIMTCIG